MLLKSNKLLQSGYQCPNHTQISTLDSSLSTNMFGGFIWLRKEASGHGNERLEASCPVEKLVQFSRRSLPHGVTVLLGGMYGYHDCTYSPFYCRQCHWMGGTGRPSHWRRRSPYRSTRHVCLARDFSRTTETVTSSRMIMTDNLCVFWKDWSSITKIMK
jgi:hypothetical protein